MNSLALRSLLLGVLVASLAHAGGSESSKKPSIEDLVKRLKSPEVSVRREAAQALRKLGLKAFDSLPDLVAALRDKDDEVRMWSGLAIASFGPKAKTAIPALIDALDDPRIIIAKRDASEALINIGTPALPALIQAAQHEKRTHVRGAAIMILASFSEEAKDFLPDLLKAAKNDQVFVRRSLAWALGNLGQDHPSCIPVLADLVQDDDVEVCERAGFSLGRIGAVGAPAAPKLRAALKNKDARARHAIFHGLGKIGAKDPATVKLLKAALTDPEYADNRASVAHGIGHLGAAGAPAVAELTDLLTTKDMSTFFRVTEALARIGPAAKDAVPALIERLKETSNPEAQRNAAYALGNIGADAKEAVPLLIDSLRRREDPLQNAASYHLTRMGAPAVAALLAEAKAGKPDMRRQALTILGQMKSIGKEALPDLLGLLKFDGGENHSLAAQAVGNIGPDAAAAIPLLIENLHHITAGQYEAEALGKIGAGNPKVLSALVQALMDKDAPIARRASAAWALGEFGRKAKDAVSALVEVLQNEGFKENTRVYHHGRHWLSQMVEGPELFPITLAQFNHDPRACILFSLGKLGPQAKEAAPTLAKLSTQEATPLFERWAALVALGKIGRAAPKEVLAAATVLLEDELCPLPLQVAAVQALGALGPDARSALPLLQEARTQRDRMVRQAAAQALARIVSQ